MIARNNNFAGGSHGPTPLRSTPSPVHHSPRSGASSTSPLIRAGQGRTVGQAYYSSAACLWAAVGIAVCIVIASVIG